MNTSQRTVVSSDWISPLKKRILHPINKKERHNILYGSFHVKGKISHTWRRCSQTFAKWHINHWPWVRSITRQCFLAGYIVEPASRVRTFATNLMTQRCQGTQRVLGRSSCCTETVTNSSRTIRQEASWVPKESPLYLLLIWLWSILIIFKIDIKLGRGRNRTWN